MPRPLILAQLALLASAIAAHGPGYVQFELERRPLAVQSPEIVRRDSEPKAWDLDMMNRHLGYFTDIGVGTPPQWLSVHIDTGSSDTWLPSVSACKNQRRKEKCLGNAFRPNQSTTVKDPKSSQGLFLMKYLDGTTSKGDYIKDTVHIAGAVIEDQLMGLGHNTSLPYGVLGLGYHHLVALWYKMGMTYDNLPLLMWKQGLVNTVAYSMWLGKIGSAKGNLMFGAIDGSKFIGKLKRVPILRDKIRKQYIYFTVDLTSVTVVSPTDVLRIDRKYDPIKVFLDSGSTVSYLPQDVSERIWNEVGAVYFRKYNAPMIECENANSTGGIRFKLGSSEGQLITVPMSELVLLPGLVPKAEDLVGEAGAWRGRNLCQFGIRNSSANANILGDSFLRSAYVVYDLVNHEVGIAQARMEATGAAEVIPFPTYGARIPELERGLEDD